MDLRVLAVGDVCGVAGLQFLTERLKALKAEHAANEASAMKALRKIMRPELVNRFDSIITFNALSEKDVNRIFDNMIEDLKKRTGLRDEAIAYIGDNLIDLHIMLQVGLPMAVADAIPDVRMHSLVVSCCPGGRGAVRELLEFIFKAQGKWEDLMASFLIPVKSEENAGLIQ